MKWADASAMQMALFVMILEDAITISSIIARDDISFAAVTTASEKGNEAI